MNYYLHKFLNFFKRPANNDFQIPPPLVPYVTPFGSRIWGGYTTNSDVDLLARQEDDGHIFHLLNTLGISFKRSVGYWHDAEKITFFYNSFRFEISCFDHQDYPAQLQTIRLCTSYFQERPSSASEKSYRTYVFEHFRDFFKQHRKLPTSLYAHIENHYPELLI